MIRRDPVNFSPAVSRTALADPEWAQLLKPADQRGLTPLFWQHVQPYGEVRLDVAKRLSLGGAAQAPEASNPD